MTKLHIGCGKKFWPGFINVDLHFPDEIPEGIEYREGDICELPFEKHSANEIHAIHCIEHLFRHKAVAALSHWREILKPGGLLVLEMPCLESILQNFARGLNAQQTIWGLYGEQTEIANGSYWMQHMWCWGESEIITELRKAGYSHVRRCQVQFHSRVRDMRVEARA